MDKRRYVPSNPSPRRDKISDMDDEMTGNAAADGFTVRYRKPLERPAYSSDNLYRENYACEGLMNEDEVRSRKLYGDPD